MRRRPIGCRPNTPAEDAARDAKGEYRQWATFEYMEQAHDAATAAMPRRTRQHHRPHAQYVGAYDLWAVIAPGNLIMRADGTMYDHARKVTVRR